MHRHIYTKIHHVGEAGESVCGTADFLHFGQRAEGDIGLFWTTERRETQGRGRGHREGSGRGAGCEDGRGDHIGQTRINNG